MELRAAMCPEQLAGEACAERSIPVDVRFVGLFDFQRPAPECVSLYVQALSSCCRGITENAKPIHQASWIWLIGMERFDILFGMPKISMLIGDDDLRLIDSVSRNRTAFMVEAAVTEAKRRRRELEDAEIRSICRENADFDRGVASDWASTLMDGLKK